MENIFRFLIYALYLFTTMAPFGSSSYSVLLVLLLLLVTITTLPLPSSQTGIYHKFNANSQTFVFGGSALELSPSIVQDNCSPGVVYGGEQFALLMAITQHDLDRFANYTCDVDCAARWIQLGGGIYERKVDCRTINEHNCSHYVYPVKEGDLANLQLAHHYSDCGRGNDRSCAWAYYQPENSRPDYYAQMVTNWSAGMRQVEQYRSRGGAPFCYNLPTEFVSSRRKEFNATILHSFRQTLEVGWYFEHFTLANFLEPFCGPRAVFHPNSKCTFHYFVWSLTSAVPSATAESLRSYMFSICPVYGTLFPVSPSADLPIPNSYLNASMIVPDIMHRYVSRVMMPTDIRVYESGDTNNTQMTIVSGDALKWIVRDFLIGCIKDDYKHSSIHRSINRKIVFYLLVPQMAEQLYKLAQEKVQDSVGKKKVKEEDEEKMTGQIETSTQSYYFGYIVGGLVCAIVLILVVWHYYCKDSIAS